VTYLGKKGILNLANSLMVGYMSGIEQGDENPGSLSDFEFDEKCIDDLLMPLSANSVF
jgi:hypothetical protein